MTCAIPRVVPWAWTTCYHLSQRRGLINHWKDSDRFPSLAGMMHVQELPAFGALLRRHRQAARLTQEELAERAGLSTRAVIDLERGARLAPRRETVHLLAEALALDAPARTAFAAAARQGTVSVAGAVPTTGAAERSPSGIGAVLDHRGGYLGALPPARQFGREEEVRRLLAGLAEAEDGRARLVLLSGEPGVGKTRLAQEITVTARERGFHVLIGRCREQYVAVPFYPFQDILTSALDAASAPLRREAAHRFPNLGRLIPEELPSPPMYEGDDARPRILRSVSNFLTALAAEAPLLVAIDDLHWADSTSLELLIHLVRRMSETRLLLIGLYREVEVNRRHPLEALLVELARDQLVEEISLHGLSAADTAALIGERAGPRQIAMGVCETIHARTAGNPFFTVEIVKALMERDAAGSRTAASTAQALAGVEVPRSVRSVVGQRISRLEPAALDMLRVASVIGQEWDLDVLMGALDQGETTILDALDAALAGRLIEERWVGRSARYAFVHALIAQTLYEEVPRHRVRKLHLRVAEVLEQGRGPYPEAAAEIARHYVAAGDPRAIPYTIRAGDHAARLNAHAEAVAQFETALDLLVDAHDLPGAALTWEKLGRVRQVQGRYDEALEAFAHALTVHKAAQAGEEIARVTAHCALTLALQGAYRDGIARLQTVLVGVQLQGVSPLLGLLSWVWAYLHFACGDYMTYLSVSRQTAELARELNDRHLSVQADVHLANALQMLGRIQEAVDVASAAIPLCELENDSTSLIGLLFNTAAMQSWKGRTGEARSLANRAVDTGERAGDPMWLSFALWIRGDRTCFAVHGTWPRRIWYGP